MVFGDILGGDTNQIITLGGAFLLGALLAYLVAIFVMRRRSRSNLAEKKDEFVGLASHYLLTPISIIQGALASLQEKESTLTIDERHKLYENINKGQQRLWILAEQFLLVSQTENGALRLKLETGSVSDGIQGAMSAVDLFAREKGIKLVFNDSSSALQQMRFDARRFKQAVLAVLDNAIKFSPEGSTVSVTLRGEPGIFAIDIADNGPGMTPEAIRTATERFARGTSSYTFDHEGIGLGLYTANAIVREHGGELTFQTEKKQGTVVTLRFPNQ